MKLQEIFIMKRILYLLLALCSILSGCIKHESTGDTLQPNTDKSQSETAFIIKEDGLYRIFGESEREISIFEYSPSGQFIALSDEGAVYVMDIISGSIDELWPPIDSGAVYFT